MKKPKRQFYRWLVWLCLVVLFAGCKLWTVRPIGWQEKKTMAAAQSFDANRYVETIWDSKVIPTVTEKAIDLATLLTALEANADEAKKQFGIREGEGATHFIVKGEGVVTRADQTSPHGTVTIRLPKYAGKAEITMQIGPVFRGTALRDCVGFIKFNEFTNQLQFAEVSTKLHERVKEKVVREIDPHQGDQVSFYAVFTLNEREKIMLTPVKLAWGGNGQ
jgi:predicted lipoprotein